MTSPFWRKPKPTRREDPEKMAMAKQCGFPLHCAHACNQAVNPGTHLRGNFPARPGGG